VTRLVERVARVEATAADRVKTTPVGDPIATYLQRQREPAPRMVSPVPLVLARASAAAEPAVRTSWDVVSSQNVSAAAPNAKAAAAASVNASAGFSPADVSRLADRVVATIDRRIAAARERLGG
jgi:hypothetical protein